MPARNLHGQDWVLETLTNSNGSWLLGAREWLSGGAGTHSMCSQQEMGISTPDSCELTVFQRP